MKRKKVLGWQRGLSIYFLALSLMGGLSAAAWLGLVEVGSEFGEGWTGCGVGFWFEDEYEQLSIPRAIEMRPKEKERQVTGSSFEPRRLPDFEKSPLPCCINLDHVVGSIRDESFITP